MSATLIDARRGNVSTTSQSSHKDPPRLHGRILVADDSGDGRDTISSVLACMGLDVALVGNGRAAFQIALSAWKGGRPFDLVLMDAQMPEIDGYEATALLRAVGYHGRIIALVSCRFEGSHDKCMTAGCDGYASKPISYRMLRNAIERYLPAEAGQPHGSLRSMGFEQTPVVPPASAS